MLIPCDELGSCEEGPGGIIPEPGAWAMMIIGFGGVGAMVRRRRSYLATA